MRVESVRRIRTRVAIGGVAAATVSVLLTLPGVTGPATGSADARDSDRLVGRPTFSDAVAHDRSAPLRSLAANTGGSPDTSSAKLLRDPGPVPADAGHSRDAALQRSTAAQAAAIPGVNFEGMSNQDNFNIYGGRVNPPDPVGDVGPNHYVEMVNLAVAVYSKTGNKLLGPIPIGSLWQNFAVPDCTDPSGDPIVVYDQLANRWILSQFTTSGLDDPSLPFFNCVAISATPNPTGAYNRYAFTTGFNFPDYPKYGVWTNSYTITTREFGPAGEYGIGVYGLEKAKMIAGQPARAVSFFLDGNAPQALPLVGDGLLPADIDGTTLPADGATIPIVGTQDDDAFYGAAFDALNIFGLSVQWANQPRASLALEDQLPVADFDSIYPCKPDARDCLPQPGVNSSTRWLDILSYRQRPTWRLAYRVFDGYESLVTNQSVEARTEQAGVRWYEIRRTGGAYSLHQQGTYAPDDGIHRWMGSIAQDRAGNMAVGYSVVNGINVFPGIRYAGRLSTDPLGELTVPETTIIDGTGAQTTKNSRWGDYTSMNIDPTDDCTFWYVNEYYTAAGAATAPNGWQTRIASFRLPGC
jgi:hypothetical protein